MIKKITFLLLFGVILIGTSCKKDEPTIDELQTERIKGEWTLVDYQAIDGTSVTTENGVSHTTTFSWVATELQDCKTNFADNTYSKSGNFKAKMSITNDGQTTNSIKASSFEQSGSWTLSDGDVTLTNNESNHSNKCKIIVLDAHNFKTRTEEKITKTTGDVTETTSQTVIAVYSR